MTKSKKLTFKLFRGQNVSASRGKNEQAGSAKKEKSISEAARLLDGESSTILLFAKFRTKYSQIFNVIVLIQYF